MKLVIEAAPSVCGAVTNSGSRCTRATRGGRCWQHGGAKAGDAGLPPPPPHLGQDGQECWYEIAGRFRAQGTLDRLDLAVLEKTAEVSEGGRACWRAVQRLGPVVRGRTRHEVKKNPAAAQHLRYIAEFRRLVKLLRQAKEEPSADVPDEPQGIARYL